tara:strand:- start:4352 stop:4789 length:438 start_codon:yes stop_codon:yes gene_type:complete
MAKISVIVEDSLGNAIYGAKGYIGTKDGEFLYDRSKGGISNPSGEFTLDVIKMDWVSQYVWVKDSHNNYEAKQLYISAKKTPYKFVIPRKVQDIEEVVIRVARPKKEEPKKEKKKNLFPLYLFGSIGIAIIGFILYQKNKRKNGS